MCEIHISANEFDIAEEDFIVKENADAASTLIDQKIQTLDDWRGETLTRIRTIIKAALPDVVEEWKWRGTPVWSHNGIICTGETYKAVVKMTFAKGASLPDPKGLFNSSLDGNVRRAIDVREGEKINAKALTALIRAAAALNETTKAKTKKSAVPAVKLLSGGNPQIAKADGDAPVQAYIAAMPEWKRDVGRRLDALIERVVPGVEKCVKWNSPMYGVKGQGWFVSFHVFTHYVKVVFFMGAHLPSPLPGGKQKDARWIDVKEGALDEEQMAEWIRQAAAIPGWVP